MVRSICRILPGVWLALLLTACVAVPGNLTATTDYDHRYNFSLIQKIAIQPIAKATLSTMMMSDEQISRINQALHEELLRRGFQVVTVNSQADIFLSWKLLPAQSNATSTFSSSTNQVAGGTLYVNMIDPLSLQAVWRATFYSRLHAQLSETEATQYRQQAARAILAQFPPVPVGS